MIKHIITFSFLIITLIGHISGSMAGDWSGETKVTDLQLSDSGHVYARFESMINPDGCPDLGWIILQSSHVAIDRIYSGLMSAKVTNMDIRYHVQGCTSIPIMRNIWMK